VSFRRALPAVFRQALTVARRLYTPELANRSLPLVARIAADIQVIAGQVRTASARLQAGGGDTREKGDQLAVLSERFTELVRELEDLGVELKDPFTGLLDFRATRAGEEVYLCWRLGEASVAHWHELAAGLAGRRPLAEF